MRPALVTYSDPDLEHEERLRATLDASIAAGKAGRREAATALWKAFVELVGQRSAEQVAKMERERGLS